MKKLLSLLLVTSLTFTGCYSTNGPGIYAIRSAKTAYASSAGVFPSDVVRNSSNTERYDDLEENLFLMVDQSPRSTFSVDVDTASYANVRRMINSDSDIPKGAVRIEEMINYFDYNYPSPVAEVPFSIADEVSNCPWEKNHQLVRIALSGKEIETNTLAGANLVFLVDVSGSMEAKNKLPLLTRSLEMMIKKLKPEDRIAIVTYAGNSGLALKSTPCSEAHKIRTALKNLSAGGSTAGADGIELAYQIAQQNFVEGGINRVILATDGDFNVGVSSDSDLVDLIEDKATSGVFLSVLGYGMGNLNDQMLEKLSGKGNGNYAYIDTINEARKVLVREVGGSIVTIAKDVKLQVEFNPTKVQAYRLIGYENRKLADRDFNDDKKDAGEIGAGHQVTAFYEIVPVGVKFNQPGLENPKYQTTQSDPTEAAGGDELLTVDIRYKSPQSSISQLLTHVVKDARKPFQQATPDFRFASAVAAFGMLLRDSEFVGTATRKDVVAWAKTGQGADQFGYRGEFIDLVKKAKAL